MENQKTGDEIDLGQLFKKIGAGLADLWMGLMRFFALIRRIPIENRYSFIGIISVSVGLAIAYSIMLKKRYYESTLILSSGYLNTRLVDNTIEKLDLLAGEGNRQGLARIFHIPDSLAQKIIGFEAQPFVSEEEIIETEILREQLKNSSEASGVVDNIIDRIQLENRRSFEITIRTLDATIIPNLEGVLIEYIKDNEYVKRRIEINRANLEQKKIKVESELQKLDSLKSVIYANYKSLAGGQTRNGSNNVILSDRSIVSPVEVFTQDMTLYNEWQEINRSLYLRSDFEVIDGFTEFTEPASPSMPIVMLIALVLGVFVAYLDVAVRSFNRYLATLT